MEEEKEEKEEEEVEVEEYVYVIFGRFIYKINVTDKLGKLEIAMDFSVKDLPLFMAPFAYNSKVYLVGGQKLEYQGNGYYTVAHSLLYEDGINRKVFVFDPADATPSRSVCVASDIPAPKAGKTLPKVFYLDGKVYLLASYSANYHRFFLPDPAFECFDPGNNTWTSLPEPPFYRHPNRHKREEAATITNCCAFGRNIYISNPATGMGAYCYNVDDQEWKYRDLVPFCARPPRNSFCCVEQPNKEGLAVGFIDHGIMAFHLTPNGFNRRHQMLSGLNSITGSSTSTNGKVCHIRDGKFCLVLFGLFDGSGFLYLQTFQVKWKTNVQYGDNNFLYSRVLDTQRYPLKFHVLDSPDISFAFSMLEHHKSRSKSEEHGLSLKVVQSFQELLAKKKYKESAELAAKSPQGILCTPDTLAELQCAPFQAGGTQPFLHYRGKLMARGKLNAVESLELSHLAVKQNKKNLLENWLAEDKLECSEELGDIVKTVDKDLGLKIYVKARATPKVIAALAEQREFDKILMYSKEVGYMPDYLFLLQTLLRADPQGAVNFALMMSQMEGGCPVDYTTITDLFVESNLIREATAFLLDVLKPNLPEDASLQTKVLEINLVTSPIVADSILARGMFSHYDRPRIAQLCEKAGLYVQALQHYSELHDIRRVIVNTHKIEPQSVVEFLGTLSKEWAFECMKDLLTVNLGGNLQIVLQVTKEYSEKLGVENCMKLFEQFKSYKGLYFFLGSLQSSSEDPDICFKYIEAAAKTGQIKEVDRVTRESNFYDAEKTKNFLMEAKLTDARPLINVCDRFGFVPELTHYLYMNNKLHYIKHYVLKVNPENAFIVVGQLLDDECPEDFIKSLIHSVRSLLPVEPLVEECEKRNRLRLLTQFLEHLVSEGSQEVHVHNALGKIIVDCGNNPKHFLTNNPYYDSRVIGKYCEKRDPILVAVAYCRGKCDDELINFTNNNSLFKLQARYVVERMDGDLWEKVLDPENAYRRELINQVVSCASKAFKALMKVHMHHECIEPLEKIVLQKSAFSGNFDLQNLLFLTAIKADPSRVMGYIHRLDNFDGPVVGEVAVEAKLFEEAFEIFKKFNLNIQAVNVLLDNIGSIDRAVEFASFVSEDAIWSQVAQAQLRKGLLSDAIESFICADDATQFLDVICASEDANVYHDLVRYLEMVRQKAREPEVDSELIYAYAKIDSLDNIEELILMPNVANLQNVGDRLYEEALYEAAKRIFAFISNWARLAITLVKLKQFEGAIDAARKANSAKTWKEVCFACVDAKDFGLARICALSIFIQVDDLEEVSEYYQNRGCSSELISLAGEIIQLIRHTTSPRTEGGVRNFFKAGLILIFVYCICLVSYFALQDQLGH